MISKKHVDVGNLKITYFKEYITSSISSADNIAFY